MSLTKPQFQTVAEHPGTGYQKLPVTMEVIGDEKVWALWELNLRAPDSRSRRRYQILIVNRNGKRAQHMSDMGLEELYPAAPLSIPGLWIESVALVRECADEFRMKNMMEELGVGPSDLVGDFYDDIEQRYRQMKRVSQFGPTHIVQRSY